MQLHQPSRPARRRLPVFTAPQRGKLPTVVVENRRTAIEMSRRVPATLARRSSGEALPSRAGRPRRGFRPKNLYAPVMIRIVAKADPKFGPLVASLVDRAAALPEHIEAAARDVIRQVRRGGDAAIRELTQHFENRRLDALELSKSDWQASAARVEPSIRTALETAAARIRAFHERERYHSFQLHEPGGARLGLRVAPLAVAGIYVPGGKALYP